MVCVETFINHFVLARQDSLPCLRSEQDRTRLKNLQNTLRVKVFIWGTAGFLDNAKLHFKKVVKKRF